jgi:hypothetical protein
MKLLKVTMMALAALGVSGQQVLDDPYSIGDAPEVNQQADLSYEYEDDEFDNQSNIPIELRDYNYESVKARSLATKLSFASPCTSSS